MHVAPKRIFIKSARCSIVHLIQNKRCTRLHLTQNTGCTRVHLTQKCTQYQECTLHQSLLISRVHLSVECIYLRSAYCIKVCICIMSESCTRVHLLHECMMPNIMHSISRVYSMWLQIAAFKALQLMLHKSASISGAHVAPNIM